MFSPIDSYSMTRKIHSRRAFLIKSAIGATALASLGSFGLILHKDQTWVESEPYRRVSDSPADTAVIVYSRSGNTLVAAKEFARLQEADLFTIEAPAYPQTFSGQMKASDDASRKIMNAEIIHSPVDLSRYDRVVLCSPVWWYRPAVPMWAFINNHEFSQQDVFLLMTGNSGFKTAYIEEFAELVHASNGRFTGFHFIERGRVFWQLSANELRGEVRTLVSSNPDSAGRS